jgi:hypothetical protein
LASAITTRKALPSGKKGLAITLDTFKKPMKYKELKIIYATGATAGAHGQNYCEFIVRVRDGGQDAMQALFSATSLSAELLNLGHEIASITAGMKADIGLWVSMATRLRTSPRPAAGVRDEGRKVYENVARGSHLMASIARAGSSWSQPDLVQQLVLVVNDFPLVRCVRANQSKAAGCTSTASAQFARG